MLSVCASHDRHVYPPLQGSDAIKKGPFVKGRVPVLVLVRVMQALKSGSPSISPSIVLCNLGSIKFV
jgi:hypothetical protein